MTIDFSRYFYSFFISGHLKSTLGILCTVCNLNIYIIIVLVLFLISFYWLLHIELLDLHHYNIFFLCRISTERLATISHRNYVCTGVLSSVLLSPERACLTWHAQQWSTWRGRWSRWWPDEYLAAVPPPPSSSCPLPHSWSRFLRLLGRT